MTRDKHIGAALEVGFDGVHHRPLLHQPARQHVSIELGNLRHDLGTERGDDHIRRRESMVGEEPDDRPFASRSFSARRRGVPAPRQFDDVGEFRQVVARIACPLPRRIAGHGGNQRPGDGIVVVDDQVTVAGGMDVEFDPVSAGIDRRTERIDCVLTQAGRAAAVREDQAIEWQGNLSVRIA